jgi:hypothetical protein
VKAIEAAKKRLSEYAAFSTVIPELAFEGICCHKEKGKDLTFNKTSAQNIKMRSIKTDTK